MAIVVTHDIEGGLDEIRKEPLVYAVPLGHLVDKSVPLGFAKAAELVRDLVRRAAVDGLGVADKFEDVLSVFGQVAVRPEEGDDLLAGHLAALGFLLVDHARDERHDVVVIDEGGGEEDKLEVDVLHHVRGLGGVVGRFCGSLLTQFAAQLEVGRAEGQTLLGGHDGIDAGL